MPRALPARIVRKRASIATHEIARDERLPALVRPDPVRPLLVGERAGGAERHHEDDRPRAVQRHELVLDDAHPDGLQEGAGPPGLAVEEVEHRVATVRMRAYPGGRYDVDGLVTPAERRARDLESGQPSPRGFT